MRNLFSEKVHNTFPYTPKFLGACALQVALLGNRIRLGRRYREDSGQQQQKEDSEREKRTAGETAGLLEGVPAVRTKAVMAAPPLLPLR